MIDTKGPINPPSDGNQYNFVIVDAFPLFVTIMCAPKNAHYAYTALFEHYGVNVDFQQKTQKLYLFK